MCNFAVLSVKRLMNFYVCNHATNISTWYGIKGIWFLDNSQVIHKFTFVWYVWFALYIKYSFYCFITLEVFPIHYFIKSFK